MGPSPLVVPSVRTSFACVLLTSSMLAQSLGDWRPVETRTVPPSRSGFALAELPGGDLLLIGGDSASPAAIEWRWNGIEWSPATTNVPRRDEPAVAHLGPNTMLFGGVANGQLLSDTWITSNGVAWSQSSALPMLLTDVSLAADIENARYVLIGKDFAGTYQTWFWNVSWTQGPSFQAFDARLVTDRLRQRVLRITDDFSSTSVALLDGAVWESFAQVPVSVALGEVAFDTRRGRAVLLQPFDDLQVSEWDGVQMLQSGASQGAFLPPGSAAMAYHAGREEVVLLVDRGNGFETLRHAVDALPASQPFGSPCGAELALTPGSLPVPGATHGLQSSVAVGDLSISAIGFSRTMSGGVSLPLALPGLCTLEVDPAIPTLLGSNATPTQFVTIPSSAQLLGERYQAQFVVLEAGGALSSTNGLEVQIGNVPAEFSLRETFTDFSNRDPLASGDFWFNGAAVPTRVGGDGRHGSFDLSLTTQVAPGVYELDTDQTLIPAERTLTGTPFTVQDGRFFFSDFVVPAGVTVRCVGSSPARIYVRGRAEVLGTVSVDAPDMPSTIQTSGPATGMPVSTFNARLGPAGSPGQPGGAGGSGGGRGGNGGAECGDLGPIVVGGIDVTSGQDGEDVQVAGGHAYASMATGTGGAGSPLMPASGTWGVPPFAIVGIVYSAYHSRGGNGGGFAGPGGAALQPTHVNPIYTIQSSPAQAASAAFGLLPLPAGVESIDHFLVGGSGGGGGGSHGYGLLAIGGLTERWMKGHGGAGGGGALAIRAGSEVVVSGSLRARGGSCPIVSGDDPSNLSTTDSFGISSPGGGGSGGSVLVQAPQAQISGALDVSGGAGGVNGFLINPLLMLNGGGGDGSDGFFRVETLGPFVFGGTSSSPFVPGDNSGQLQDLDDRTGSRSLWMVPASAGLPIWTRYELLVEVNGLPVLFSDDPEVSPLQASGPSSPVELRLQGARIDAQGQVLQATAGPWRTRAGEMAAADRSLNADFAQAVRFDIVLDKSLGALRVLDLRIFWR